MLLFPENGRYIIERYFFARDVMYVIEPEFIFDKEDFFGLDNFDETTGVCGGVSRQKPQLVITRGEGKLRAGGRVRPWDSDAPRNREAKASRR